MKKYKLFIRKYNMMKNDYEIVEKIVETNDIYHEIGYIYCTTLEKIKRIDYIEIRDSIEIQKIQEAFESIEKYFDRLNGPDEDLEYIREIKEKLLGGE